MKRGDWCFLILFGVSNTGSYENHKPYLKGRKEKKNEGQFSLVHILALVFLSFPSSWWTHRLQINRRRVRTPGLDHRKCPLIFCLPNIVGLTFCLPLSSHSCEQIATQPSVSPMSRVKFLHAAAFLLFHCNCEDKEGACA